MDRIHKPVQVFLYSYNITAVEDVGLGALTEFGGIQKKLERGEWLTSTPVWVDRPAKRRRDSGNLTDRVREKGQAVGEVEETMYSTTEYTHSCGSWRDLDI